MAAAGFDAPSDDLSALREALATLSEGLAEEIARLADLRKRSVEARAQAEEIKRRSLDCRLATAEQAADRAEAYAAYLENSATGQDRGRRIRMARQEREIAAMERRKAERLRERARIHLERESTPH
jgi:hypothetical protein